MGVSGLPQQARRVCRSTCACPTRCQRRNSRGQLLVDADETGTTVGSGQLIGDPHLARYGRVFALELDGLDDLCVGHELDENESVWVGSSCQPSSASQMSTRSETCRRRERRTRGCGWSSDRAPATAGRPPRRATHGKPFPRCPDVTSQARRVHSREGQRCDRQPGGSSSASSSAR